MSGASGGFDDPRGILAVLEQRARRRFGQHFLSDQGVVDRIVRRSGVGEGDPVLEIGPGLGILTHALTRAGARLVAVELDRDLADHIRRVFPNVRLVEGDALRQDWPALLDGTPHTVVANLPYNVGTHVVMKLLDHPSLFPRVVVMLQKEVVDRLLAVPGTKAYGALTVQVQARARAVHLLAVPPRSFHPRPKVDSAVVRLEPHPVPRWGPATRDAFDRTVRAAFSHRRKTLPNSLAPLYGRERARQALRDAGIDPGLRAERLDLDAFRALAARLHPPDPAPSPPASG